MTREEETIWNLLKSCAEKLTAEGRAPFRRGDLIACVRHKNPRYGPDSINPMIQGITSNLRGGSPGGVGKDILFSVARGQFVLYREAQRSGFAIGTPAGSRNASARQPAMRAPSVTNGIPQISYSKTMIVLPCSGSKSQSTSSSQGVSILDLLSSEVGNELIAQRARNAERASLDAAKLARAIDRYDGTLYAIARSAVEELIAKGTQVLVLSGGYGVVLANEAIGTYDARFRSSMWPNRIIERCLAECAAKTGIMTAIGILSRTTDYAHAFRRARWPSTVSNALLVTPQRSRGAMVKAPRAQGEALLALAASGRLDAQWQSSDGLSMEIVPIETS